MQENVRQRFLTLKKSNDGFETLVSKELKRPFLSCNFSKYL